jgi:uncharacterized protein YndB with AHSA1/START domain
MAAVQPTGNVVRDSVGLQLVLERRLPVLADEAWQWLTSPTLLEQWFGTVGGTPAVGEKLTVAVAESAVESVRVARCEPGIRFALEWTSEADTNSVTVSIAGVGASTVVYLSRRLRDWRQAGAVGPRWEYALDRLVAAQSGAGLPRLDDYATQRPYFERLALDGEPLGSETTASR